MRGRGFSSVQEKQRVLIGGIRIHGPPQRLLVTPVQALRSASFFFLTSIFMGHSGTHETTESCESLAKISRTSRTKERVRSQNNPYSMPKTFSGIPQKFPRFTSDPRQLIIKVLVTL